MTEHNHGAPLTDLQLRAKALEAVLIDKGLVDEATLDAITDHWENKVGPHIGAQIVARAWADPDFKRDLLEDGSATIAKLDFPAARARAGPENSIVSPYNASSRLWTGV